MLLGPTSFARVAWLESAQAVASLYLLISKNKGAILDCKAYRLRFHFIQLLLLKSFSFQACHASTCSSWNLSSDPLWLILLLSRALYGGQTGFSLVDALHFLTILYSGYLSSDVY